jgi:hypothetical protein
MVKSVYLSTGRFDEAEDKERYEKELEEVGHQIRRGENICYDEAELARLLAQKHLVERIPARVVWTAIGRFFLPGLVFLVLLLAIWYLLRLLR